MKTILAVTVLVSLSLPAQAQIFSHNAIQGAALGGIAGAIIGNNSGHGNGARGAAIGAGAGLLLGAAAGDHHRGHSSVGVAYPVRPHAYYSPHYTGHAGYYRHGSWYRPNPVVYVQPAPIVYGSSYYGNSYYDNTSPSYGSAYYSEPSYAANGLVLGGIAGAIIGNNSGHGNGLRGGLIGAGTGLVLGALMDNDRRPQVVERPPVYTEAAPSTPAAPAPQNVTIINNYYSTPSTPMSSANSLFGR